MAFDTYTDRDAIADARRMGRELRRLPGRRAAAPFSSHGQDPSPQCVRPSSASTPGLSSAGFCAVPATPHAGMPAASRQQISHCRTNWGWAPCIQSAVSGRTIIRRRDTSDTPKHELTIELRNVVREYRVGGQSVRALDEISLRLQGGQFASVVGPSGAGKSTLLHMLGALDSPDSGSITFDGDEIGRLNDEQQSEFRHHCVGFIFQFFNLLPTLSAWENVAVPKLLDGVRLGRAKPDAVRLLDRVGLADRTEHRPSELSGGQMQRVAVARALMMDPPLILADEPTGNLDSATGASILALLAEVAHEEGRCRLVVMVTHNLDATAATDRVITLQDGRLGSDELSVVPR
jgi:putative ABC transport system ATP-binding protein